MNGVRIWRDTLQLIPNRVFLNTDWDATIGEIADVTVLGNLKQFIPALMENGR